MTITRPIAVASVALFALISATSVSAQSLRFSEAGTWPDPATSAAGTPAVWNFGQVSGVATTVNGYILVLHRGAQPIMLFDPGGRFVRAWGDGLFSHGKVGGIVSVDRQLGESGYTAVYGPAGCHNCGAHAIRVDPDGNIWVVDAPGHVIYKMDFQGRVLMELGSRGVAGQSRNTFNLPTDVGFGLDGSVYVSDGYGNARVVKYSSDGRYLLEWGRRGTGPGEFGLPHNIVVDDQGRVYVTDRDNQRVEVFDADGQFLAEWPTLGGNSALFLTEDQHIWTGGMLRSLDGEPVATLPGGDGGHGMTVTDDGEVFVAQLRGRIQKFVSEEIESEEKEP
ncbi:MAG: peptidyl-alpha-hydroxyglycine alpha-amidating lyase family protein [Acidobacteriota bacterium]|nr:peptidyl-alpha-hydroxyglycine alpha-amidating lyase family protein [Acidobacteriota bacterium]